MHDGAYNFIAECAAEYVQEGKHAVDLGGHNINGNIRELFPKVASWTAVDMTEDPSVDIIGDITTTDWVPIDTKYDLVCCTEVLEHLENWKQVLRVAHTICTDCTDYGTLLITTAANARSPHNMHGLANMECGEYYKNISATELTDELSKYFRYVNVNIGRARQDLYAVAYDKLPYRKRIKVEI